jgi:hypothetical protein
VDQQVASTFEKGSSIADFKPRGITQLKCVFDKEKDKHSRDPLMSAVSALPPDVRSTICGYARIEQKMIVVC